MKSGNEKNAKHRCRQVKTAGGRAETSVEGGNHEGWRVDFCLTLSASLR